MIGREAETALLERVIEEARDGRSGVLVVRGEPGVGKSVLLEHAVARAEGMRILKAVGIESEAELAYAGLHQIFRPVLDRIERLPQPQAAALRSAFALSDETVDERFRVLLGVLGLFAEVADEGPVVCLVDDAQWLDQASAEALVFAARRFVAEPIALLFAARGTPEPAFAAPGLPELRLSALSPTEARVLVTQRLGMHVSSNAVEWVLAGANGNPLALLELPAALTPAQLAGREPLAGRVPPPTSVEQAYLERLGRLPDDARAILLIAAAEDTGDRATVARAAAGLGLDADALAPAEAEGLVHVRGDRIDFRHPLVRSAVYRGAGFAERESAHRALAAIFTSARDVDRRAWHRAAATVGVDADVAAELEQSAARARARGGHAAASAALERAATLTPDGPDRGRRFVDAARSASMAGLDERAAALSHRAEDVVADPLLRAEIARVRGVGQLRRGRPADAYAALLDAARDVGPLAADKAAELLSDAAIAAGLSGAVDARIVYRVAQTLDRAPLEHPWASVVQIMVGIDGVNGGDIGGGAELIARGQAQAEASDDAIQLMWAGLGAIALGDDARAGDVLARAAASARAVGSLATLALALGMRSPPLFVQGRFDEAGVDAAEAVRLARETGATNLVPHPLSVGAAVAGVRGREDEARAQAEDAIGLAASHGVGLAAGTGIWTLGMLDLVHGRYVQALDRLNALRRPRPGYGHPVVAIRTIPDRIEAAVRAGQAEDAAAELTAYEAWVGHSRAAWAEARLASCRALLADGDEAARLFEDAVRGGDNGHPFDHCRMQLLYGEHLRRTRRRIEAREQLRSALATFEQLGAVPWAERAASELRATGETARKRDPSTIDQLTPQELQIARLVADGNSNKEVAA